MGRINVETHPMQKHVESAARLGQLIQQTRHTRKLSVRQLSSMSGIPKSTIIRIEHGEIARPRPDFLAAMAKALMIPIAEIYATVHYPAPRDLPSFAPYLRVRYSDLPDEAIEELTRYFEELAAREGVRLDGPPNGEDEAR